MKHIALVSIFLLLLNSCNIKHHNKIKKVNNPEFTEMLIFGESIDLNKVEQEKNKNLWLKLHKTPNRENNNCFPESHGICHYRYYLATSQLDDNPKINSYYLGEYGDIVDYTWQKTDIIGTAIITIQFNKYTKEALHYNKSLKNNITSLTITATPKKIQVISRVKK